MKTRTVLGRLPLAALLLAGTVGAASDEPDKEETDSPSLLVRLEKITVSATRTERPVFRSPAAVSVLDREQIQQTQPYGYEDVLQDVPGVTVQGGPRRIAQEPAIRGFMDEQVVIRVDGARQNFNQAHRGRFFLDPDLVEGVEVLRGSSSAIYGSGALGGVISLDTVDPDDFLNGSDDAGGRLKTDWRSNGEALGLYGTAFAQSGSFDVLASYGRNELDEDLEDGDGDPISASRDELTDGLVKLGWDLGPNQRLSFAATRFRNEGRNPPNANAPATATNLVDRDTGYDSYRLNYDWNDPGNKWLDLHAVLYRNEVDVQEFRLDDARRDDTDFRTEGLDVFNSSRFGFLGGREAVVTYGIERYTDEQGGTRNGEDRPEFPDAEADYTAYYLQAELPLSDRLTLMPGVRQDEFEYSDARGEFPSRNEDKLTPKLSLGFQPTDDWFFWGGYAEAFRAPSLTELYASGVHFVSPLEPGEVVINEFVPTPDLAPEEAETLEAGFRWRGGGAEQGASIAGTAYRSDVDDFVDQFVVFISGEPTFDPRTETLVFPGITSNRSVDARLEGFELQGEWWRGRWFGEAMLSVVDGQNRTTGAPLASTQQDRAVFKLGFHAWDRTLRLGTRLTLAADRDDVPEDTLATDGYQTLDLFGNWTPAEGPLAGVTLRAGIDNLFNETYRVHPNGINNPGRSYKLSLAWTFGAP